MRLAFAPAQGTPHRRPFVTFAGVRTLAGGALAVWAALFGLSLAALGQTTLNVANFGAVGDAVRTWASTSSNSPVVWSTNVTTSSDIGKLIELFGVGPYTSLTNNQDLIATITNVSNGTNWLITPPPSAASNNVQCTYGTQNAAAFQNCLNACTGTNTVIQVPAGTYLLVPPAVLDPKHVMKNAGDVSAAITNYKGGITLLGADPSNTTLLGNGAWTLEGQYVQRGAILICSSPIANNFPLVFQSLTLDGGVSQGHQSYNGWPAQTTDGSGWDVTHDAVIDAGIPPLLAVKQFINCRFLHWRGEMLKSITTFDSGVIQVTNCWFVDGNASGYNFNWTPHIISGCVFSNLDMAMEYSVDTMQLPSLFANSTIANVREGIVLVGGLTNHLSPGYTIQSNTFSAVGATGVLMGPACNVAIVGNRFIGGYHAVGTDGAAYQGTDYNHDITVASNSFESILQPINIGGSGVDRLVNMNVIGNTASNCLNFATGYAWCSNVVFSGNRSLSTGGQAAFNGPALTGQWFLDDGSNVFPAYGASDDVGRTNTLTYAYGMHENAWTDKTNSVFVLDDHSPLQIPPGASLVVTNLGKYPVLLYFSSTSQSSPSQFLMNGHSIGFLWQGDHWASILNPPGDLRLVK